MYLKVENNIENNIFITSITVDSYGTEQMSALEEKELLENFPSDISYRNLIFKKNIKMNGAVPQVTDEVVDGVTVIEVTLPALSNKEIPIGDNFNATYKIDTAKIPKSAVDGSVLTSVELVAQAYCLIFKTVICEEIEAIMDALRTKAPNFEGEEIITV